MESYEHFGTATITMSDSDETTTIDAFYPSKVSTTRVLVLNVQQEKVYRDPMGVKGFAVRSNTNRTLRITFDGQCRSRQPPCKFKIIHVSSC